MTEPQPKFNDAMVAFADAVERVKQVCIDHAKQEGMTYRDALLEFQRIAAEEGRKELMPVIRNLVTDNANMSSLSRGIGEIGI